jgi:hypothetical protein
MRAVLFNDNTGGFFDRHVHLAYKKAGRLSELAVPRIPGSGKNLQLTRSWPRTVSQAYTPTTTVLVD